MAETRAATGTDDPSSAAGDGSEPFMEAASDAGSRPPVPPSPIVVERARKALDEHPLVLVGLMGVGKTTVGRQVALQLDLPFVDADEEIEAVSRMSVAELFEQFGEGEFRALERRVIERLLREGGAMVLATGGGAFMNDETRAAVLEGATTVWLRATLDVLVERTSRRSHRPLLRTGDPREILGRLIEERHPIYAEAHATIDSTGERRETVASRVVHALAERASA